MMMKGVVALMVAFVTAVVLLMWGIPVYGRYQSRQEAANRIRVNALVIQQTQQLVEVEKQKAAIRIAESRGIAESQRISDASLTTNYLQYLAIQAQMRMADSPNHTTVYIPSGTNGIPLVKTIP